MSEQMTGKEIVLMTLVRPFSLTFLEPIFFLLNLYIALIYGLLYVWFESFAIVFEGIYGFNLGEERLSFVGILVGAFIVIPPFFPYLHFIQEPRFNEKGEIQPESDCHQLALELFAFQSASFGSAGQRDHQSIGLYPSLPLAGFQWGLFCFSIRCSITLGMRIQITQPPYMLETIL
jgi:hypothetical protein